jgi:hypothetical protein
MFLLTVAEPFVSVTSGPNPRRLYFVPYCQMQLLRGNTMAGGEEGVMSCVIAELHRKARVEGIVLNR